MNDERRREEWLLKDAAILYERHKPDLPEPFNVFTVLRSESDEVKLHSPFLAALLAHRSEEGAANLRDFMGKFAPEPLRDFEIKGVKVERERHHIDILITNDCGQALAIENKIYAGDRVGQLKGYDDKLEKQGYKEEDRHILYLAIGGREPCPVSTDGLNKEKYTSISYECILPWLERCRKRAYDEPELREAIAQYSRLIKRMTGNDRRSELMEELKKLLRRDNNLLVAHNLAEALPYAKAALMHKMWERIKRVLAENSFTNPVEEYNGISYSDVSEDGIRKAIVEKKVFGLYYNFGQKPAFLCIEASIRDGFSVGVYCDNKDAGQKKYDEIKDRIGKFEDGKNDHDWPWYYVLKSDGTGLRPGDIKLLADEKSRNELADRVAESAVKKLEAIREKFPPTNS